MVVDGEDGESCGEVAGEGDADSTADSAVGWAAVVDGLLGPAWVG